MISTLRAARIPELEGDRVRLHVERKVFGGRPGAERGRSWLTLSPSSDPGSFEGAALVVLPLEQSEALAQACAAFNHIMDQHERRAQLPRCAARPSTASPCVPLQST